MRIELQRYNTATNRRMVIEAVDEFVVELKQGMQLRFVPQMGKDLLLVSVNWPDLPGRSQLIIEPHSQDAVRLGLKS